MTKIENFVSDVLEVVQNYGNTAIRKSLKDSTNRNRVVSVNQVIRFLKSRRNPAYRNLATKLDAVYISTVRQTAVNLRLLNGSARTDAVDLNEFVNAIDYRLTWDSTFSRTVANVL
jgi:hypothetical protein